MKIIKKIGIIGIVLCCIGLVLFSIGWMQGGGIESLNIQISNDSWWPFKVNMKTFMNEEKTVVYEESFIPRQQLKVHVEKASFEIRKGGTNKILLQNIEKKNIQMKAENQVLTVDVKGTKKNNQRVIMEVKDIDVIQTLSLDSSMGNSKVSDMNLEAIAVTSSMGNVELTRIISKTTNIHNETGEIIVNDAMFYHTQLTNEMGNIEFHGDLYGKNEISCEMGNVTLQLERKEEAYTYDVNASMGTVKVDDEEVIGNAAHISYGTGDIDSLHIDCEMGNVEVMFAS